MPRFALVTLALATLLAAVIALAVRRAFRGDERTRETAAMTCRTWRALLITIPYVGALSVLDAWCFFEISVVLRWLVAGLYGLLLCRLAKDVVGRWLAGAALVWMLLVLPHIRWNDAKSFYVDARRLRAGMSVEQVREIMSAYVELGALGSKPHPDDRLIYLHEADECVVRFDAGRKVHEVLAAKD